MVQWQMKKRSLGSVSTDEFRYGIDIYGLGTYGIGISQVETVDNAPIWQVGQEIRSMEKTPVDWASDVEAVRHMEKTKVDWQEKKCQQ